MTEAPGWQAGEPPVYLVSGGAGAPFSDSSPSDLEFHHYLLFTVDGGAVTVTLKKLQSKGAGW